MARVVVSTNDGEVVEIIDDLEHYNLDNPIARTELVNQIRDAQRIAVSKESK